MADVRVIMIGDVVGEPGLCVLESRLPVLIGENAADFAVVNGENAADGFGMTEAAARRIFAAGADVITGGNHIWEKRDFLPYMDAEERILRPANYPVPAAGRGWIVVKKDLQKASCNADAQGAASGVPREPEADEQAPRMASFFVINLQGREFMTAIDCPFKIFDTVAAEGRLPLTHTHPLLNPEGSGPEFLERNGVVLVDFHAESSREKEALGFYLDGRASLVAGTHTHVQTADERILPGGTAYITDLGMTGIRDSVIGMDAGVCLDRARHQVLYRMEVADGPVSMVQGIVAEIDQETGRTSAIRRIQATAG
ncbi:MAG: YmdB family metallophosphoesterase [Treponema sp.]|jgi:calcineurin-like phosphoesterase|nr:YmdB family metallophosphoesterase [Treponema sp.]